MKAILISIKPKWVAKILNGEKTLEIRKSYPKCDLPIDVYIYCTKGKPCLVKGDGSADYLAKLYDKNYVPKPKKFELYNFEDGGYSGQFYDFFNGKVVAKFTLKEVDELGYYGFKHLPYNRFGYDVEKLSCLSFNEIEQYRKGKKIYAWHIDNLEIFDEPFDLIHNWQFMKKGFDYYYWHHHDPYLTWASRCHDFEFERAPQSWCYCEYYEQEEE